MFEGLLQGEDLVGVHHRPPVEGDGGWSQGARAGGHQDDARLQHPFPRVAGHPDPAVGLQARHTANHLDAVSLQVAPDGVAHQRADLGPALLQPFEHHVPVQAQADPVDLLLAGTADVAGRLPQRLARQATGGHRGPAELERALDERHPLAVVGRLRRALLAGRAGPDDHEVEALGVHHGLGGRG